MLHTISTIKTVLLPCFKQPLFKSVFIQPSYLENKTAISLIRQSFLISIVENTRVQGGKPLVIPSKVNKAKMVAHVAVQSLEM